MRLHEILTEEQLDELNRRDFLRQATLATMGVGLGAAALDQGKSHDEADDDLSAEVDDEDEKNTEKKRKKHG